MRRNTLRAALIAVAVATASIFGATPAEAATYTRTMTCNSSGVPGYSVTLTATWQTNSAGQADLVQTVTRQYQGVTGRDWATSMTLAHRWNGVNKEVASFNPIQTNTTYFPGAYYTSKTASQVYLRASNTGTNPDTQCGPVVDNAV